MATTSASLLDRLKDAPSDSLDWSRLHALYLPFIKFWLGRILAAPGETEDLAQEVLLVVVRELPKFQRQRDGSFRAWLRLITVNQSRAYFKKKRRRPLSTIGGSEDQTLAQLEDSKSDLSQQWDREHNDHITQKLLVVVRGDFSPVTWEAFFRVAMQEQPVAKVAAELGITTNAVARAKLRVLKRLRQEAGELMS